jgi:hypothetical protein
MPMKLRFGAFFCTGILQFVTPPSAFHTLIIHFPVFSTCAVHRNYVDSVAWFGDLLFSKVQCALMKTTFV